MSLPFPECTEPAASTGEALLRYLDYFRSVIIGKLDAMPEEELRSSHVPSGWTPLELVKHLTFVELRWLEWGFEGASVDDPWGDRRDDRWFVAPDESAAAVVAALRHRGEVTRAIVVRHGLAERGQPGERWSGAEPARLDRILFHLIQEYARHAGHLDIVRELYDGSTGED